MKGIPISSYVVQLASRCNLNCSYCYVYNMGDQSWRTMPHFMSTEIVSLTASRIYEHCKIHDLDEIFVSFHGGEPLLYGTSRMRNLLVRFSQALKGIKTHWGLQTNGLLLDEEWIRLFAEYDLKVGISLDGPAKVNDRSRVDHQGAGTHSRVIGNLRHLQSAEGQRVFTGCLTVIDPDSDPLEVFRHLVALNSKVIDFLLPHANWENLPPSKCHDPYVMTPFADWLIPIFDEWFEHFSGKVEIRIFEEIMEHLAGGTGSLESLGIQPVSLIFVAPNGDIEAVDTLKSIPGQQVLGMNLVTHSFDDVQAHPKYVMRQMGANSLADSCRLCPILETCGGGYFPHRWSKANGFRNPSVYCSDLMKLILHIRARVRHQLHIASPEGPECCVNGENG